MHLADRDYLGGAPEAGYVVISLPLPAPEGEAISLGDYERKRAARGYGSPRKSLSAG